jgi:hypothetical protein
VVQIKQTFASGKIGITPDVQPPWFAPISKIKLGMKPRVYASIKKLSSRVGGGVVFRTDILCNSHPVSATIFLSVFYNFKHRAIQKYLLSFFKYFNYQVSESHTGSLHQAVEKGT